MNIKGNGKAAAFFCNGARRREFRACGRSLAHSTQHRTCLNCVRAGAGKNRERKPVALLSGHPKNTAHFPRGIGVITLYSTRRTESRKKTLRPTQSQRPRVGRRFAVLQAHIADRTGWSHICGPRQSLTSASLAVGN